MAIWREMKTGTTDEVVHVLNKMFLKPGLVDDLLMDNSIALRSDMPKEMLDKSPVCFFGAVYRPSGRNRISKRHHRTIKAVAERGRTPPLEATFCYNMSPQSGYVAESVPNIAIFRYEW